VRARAERGGRSGEGEREWSGGGLRRSQALRVRVVGSWALSGPVRVRSFVFFLIPKFIFKEL
jgi:hypothetical protein